MTFNSKLLAGFFITFLISCRTSKFTQKQSDCYVYEEAIKDAMYAENSEIDTSLIDITPQSNDIRTKFFDDTEYVLVLTWQGGKYNYPDTGKITIDSNHYIWVTVYPELLQKMKNQPIIDNDMRLRQLLGLPPNKPNKFFMEFYVKMSDLFRPCPDKEITDKKCNLCFNKQDSLDTDHIRWINNTRLLNYFSCDLYSKYPWTNLGYTYDWNPQNKNHIGLSEFVVRPNSTIHITRIDSTNEYLSSAIF